MSTFKEEIEKRIGVESDYPYTFQGGALCAAELILKEMERLAYFTVHLSEEGGGPVVKIRDIKSYIGAEKP